MIDTHNAEYHSLEELGSVLQKARQARGVSIEDVTTMTCIQPRFLEGIERGDFSGFSSWVQARGFVQKYLSLMNLMDVWPAYSPFLSDTPPVFPAPATLAEEEPTVDEALPEGEDEPVSQEKLAPGEVDEGDEPAAPLNEDYHIGEQIEAPEFSGTDRDEPDLPLAPLVSNAEVGEDEREAVSSHEDQADHAVTVQVPRRSRPSTPPRQSAQWANDPLQPPISRRKTVAPYATRRKKGGGLILLALTVLILIGAGWTWWSRRDVSLDVAPATQSQKTADTIAVLPSNETPSEGETSSGAEKTIPTNPMAADIVHVRPAQETPNQPAQSTGTSEQNAGALAASTSTSAVSASASSSKQLVIVADGDCWLDVTRDGKKIFAKIIKKGARHSFEIGTGLRVIYGAGQNVKASVDGSAPASPGGGVLRLIYAPDGTVSKQ